MFLCYLTLKVYDIMNLLLILIIRFYICLADILYGSVQFSYSVVSNSLRLHALQHARPPCPSPTPGVYSRSCPLSRWWHPTISSSCPLLLLPSIFLSLFIYYKAILGLPLCLGGKESARQCRRHGFQPWFGKITHAVEQLSPRVTTIEPVL